MKQKLLATISIPPASNKLGPKDWENSVRLEYAAQDPQTSREDLLEMLRWDGPPGKSNFEYVRDSSLITSYALENLQRRELMDGDVWKALAENPHDSFRRKALRESHFSITVLILLLDGRNMDTVEGVELAREAWEILKKKMYRVRSKEILHILQLLNHPARDRWSGEGGFTEAASGYSGPFGSVGWMHGDSEGDAEFEALLEKEEREVQRVREVRTPLINEVRLGLAKIAQSRRFNPKYWPDVEPRQGDWAIDQIARRGYPLESVGYFSPELSPIRHRDALIERLKEIKAAILSRYSECDWEGNPGKWFPDIPTPGSQMERELVLLSHQFASDQPIMMMAQAALGTLRSIEAFFVNRALHDEEVYFVNWVPRYSGAPFLNYHALAFFYYALQHGMNTLGAPTRSQLLVDELRNLRKRGVVAPRIACVGFATCYSIENLAALIHLAGFRQGKIVAIDLAREPIVQTRQRYGNRFLSVEIEYARADAAALPLPDKCVDLAVSHLLFLNTLDRARILGEIRRSLVSGAHFVDEECSVPRGTSLGIN